MVCYGSVLSFVLGYINAMMIRRNRTTKYTTLLLLRYFMPFPEYNCLQKLNIHSLTLLLKLPSGGWGTVIE